MTQVSLNPPPCEELTTNESGFRENRVSPLGHTLVSFPVTTKALRSALRSTGVSSSRISKSLKSMTSCAIQRRGCSMMRAFSSYNFSFDRSLPNTTP